MVRVHPAVPNNSTISVVSVRAPFGSFERQIRRTQCGPRRLKFDPSADLLFSTKHIGFYQRRIAQPAELRGTFRFAHSRPPMILVPARLLVGRAPVLEWKITRRAGR